MIDLSTSKALFERSQKSIPGGVNSPVRAFRSVGGTPIFMKRAKGPYMYDSDGNRYIDYINSWGPMILGHAHREVVEAIQDQAIRSSSFGTPTELEAQMAEQVIKMVPGLETIRMVNSGTEACMSAIRLARGYTGRHKIIKFSGCYHGHHDSFLVKAGSGALTFGMVDSKGVTPTTAADTLIANYNDLENVKAIFEANENEIAGIILEPVTGNMGCILPKPGFLEGIRKLCDQYGSCMILDEVMTGFRLAPGGAQEVFNIEADIVCFGKIIGGGLPVGAFGGKKRIFESLAPLGPVYQAGTLSGNPLAMAAGLKTLQILDKHPEIYAQINQRTKRLSTEVSKELESKGISHQYHQIGSMTSFFFTHLPVTNFAQAKQTDTELFGKLFWRLAERGVYLPPSNFESWFVSHTHDDDVISETLQAWFDVLSNF